MQLAASTSQFSHYGYLGVALVVGLEGLGIPVPGETALIAAAAYAGQSHQLNPWLIFALAAAAALAGNVVGYYVGLKGGFRLVKRYGPKVHLDEHKLKIGRYVLDTQGWKVVLVGRFVAVLRTYLAFMAGTLEMRKLEFFSASTAAAIIWSAFYTFTAYKAGNTLRRLSGTIDIVVVAAAVVVVAGVFLLMRTRMKKLGEKAEAAYPGPLEPL